MTQGRGVWRRRKKEGRFLSFPYAGNLVTCGQEVLGLLMLCSLRFFIVHSDWQEKPFPIRLLALVWAPSAYSKSSGCVRLGASGSQEGG